MQKLKIAFAITLGFIATVAISGYVYQTVQARNDRLEFPAPGVFFSVDGLSMHLDCRGVGSPTVILEAGLTSGSFSWTLVHDSLATITRVCAYDRPGMDWSEPVNRIADAKEVSERLHKLIGAAKIEGPKVLVGMSAGGIYVREYYRNHPIDIVGMVLIDSSHEQQAARLPLLDSSGYAAMINACRVFQPIGIVRLFGLLDPFLDQYKLDENTRNALLANMNQSHTCASMYWEGESFSNEIRDATPPKSLADLPLIVLSQGEQPRANEEYGLSLEQAIALREVWNILQQELTDLSSNGHRIIAEHSGHVIQLNQPELVIENISALVFRLRGDRGS